MSPGDEHAPTSPTPAPIRMAAGGFGVVFVAFGVLGFVPGVTTDHDELRMAGHDSGAHLFGLFQVSVLHNVLHLVLGVAGLALAGTAALAHGYLIGAGAVYAGCGSGRSRRREARRSTSSPWTTTATDSTSGSRSA